MSKHDHTEKALKVGLMITDDRLARDRAFCGFGALSSCSSARILCSLVLNDKCQQRTLSYQCLFDRRLNCLNKHGIPAAFNISTTTACLAVNQ